MINSVVCVLRSGGPYGPEYVDKLHAGFRRHLPGDWTFFCLCDLQNMPRDWPTDPRITVIGLKYAFKGWWSKPEMWSPAIEAAFGDRWLYCDLDAVVVGDLSALHDYDKDEPLITSDWYRGGASQSFLIQKKGQLQHLWDKFIKDPHRWISEGDKMQTPNFGDQILVRVDCAQEWRYVQDEFPGLMASYKIHGVPDDAGLIMFHGQPRPADIKDDWINQHWKV